MKKFYRWILTLLWAYLIWYLTTIPDFKVTSDTILSAVLSNGGHFFFFGVLALLIPISGLFSLVATSSYGLLIELIQRTIPGRSFSLLDLGLDILGAVTFLVIMKKYENSRHRWSWLHRDNHRKRID